MKKFSMIKKLIVVAGLLACSGQMGAYGSEIAKDLDDNSSKSPAFLQEGVEKLNGIETNWHPKVNDSGIDLPPVDINSFMKSSMEGTYYNNQFDNGILVYKPSYESQEERKSIIADLTKYLDSGF